MHFNILQQSSVNESINSAFIKKLYDAIEYNKSHVNTPLYDSSSSLIGNIILNGATYESWLESVRNEFQNLNITSSGTYIYFADKDVETLMINYLSAKGIGDGVGITNEQAQDLLITTIPDTFKTKTNVNTFNELYKFTNITTLPKDAFKNCSNLTSINILNITNWPISNTGIFAGTGLTSLTFNTSITTLPKEICFNCQSLESVYGMDNVTTINPDAIRSCGRLSTIDLSRVQSFGESCFNGCSGLASINLSSAISINTRAFYQCTSLATIEGLSNCTTIGNNAFYGCTILGEVDLSNVTSLYAGYAFCNCPSMTIKNNDLSSLISIGNNTFSNCSSLSGAIDISNCTNINLSDTFRNTGITSLRLPSNITTIDEGMCRNCPDLTSVDIDWNKITTIGPHAFNGCKNLPLTNIDLSNVTGIGTYAFTGVGLSSTPLTIKNGDLKNCTSIGSDAFTDCKGLTNIDIRNLASCGVKPFGNCISLTSINLANSTLTRLPDNFCRGCSSLSNVTLSSNINELGPYAFCSCQTIETIDFQNITKIGDDAISYTKIATVNLSSNATYIGQIADNEITNEFVIPATVTHLGNLIAVRIPTIKFLGANPPSEMGFIERCNSSRLNGVNVASFIGKIYVPSGSKQAYKTAFINAAAGRQSNPDFSDDNMWEEY